MEKTPNVFSLPQIFCVISYGRNLLRNHHKLCFPVLRWSFKHCSEKELKPTLSNIEQNRSAVKPA